MPRSFSRAARAQTAKHIPRKRFGQHFLTDQNILRKIVRAADVQAVDTVLEIGPGLGDLTRALAAAAARVIAVEVDRDLAARLCAEFEHTNVAILEGDILKRAPQEWLTLGNASPPYLVVANLPYYITSAILRHLLEAATPPTRIVVMVQREVAQQMTARPPNFNLLAASIQFYGSARIVTHVPAGAFRPPPKVDSAVVRIEVNTTPREISAPIFFRVVRAGFGAKRKQLRNALAKNLGLTQAEVEEWLSRARIAPARRAETLSLQEWIGLAQVGAGQRLP